MDASGDSSEPGPKDISPKKRSRWSISLGGVMIFAAGMMVGFAPMRAWLFVRDEPEFVEIDVRLFDVDTSEADEVRRAFADARSSDAAPELDPDQILARRAPSVQWLSKPKMMTLMDHEARLQVAHQRVARSSGLPPGGYSDVIDASFTPSVRLSGKLELQYGIKHTSTRSDEGGKPVESDEVGTDSSVMVENGVWRLIEIGSPTQSELDQDRSRWLLLRAKPVESSP